MRIAAWIVTAAGTLFLLFLLVCSLVNRAVGYVEMPAEVSNLDGPDSSPRGAAFKVAVLGDSQKGLANLTNIVRAVQEEEPVLMFHTGDLVSHNDEGHYRLAALALDRANLEVQLAVVPGNHDVKRGTDRFRREIGDTEFEIQFLQTTFVGLDNSTGAPPDLGRLIVRIAAIPEAQEIVLLMHVPPFDLEGKTRPAYEPFVAWLAKSRVRYLFCGHIHDYVRKTIGNTVVIANGVGGDYEHWDLDQKVYATILEVEGAKLSDRAVELPPEHGFAANVEHLAVGHVTGQFRLRPGACWSVTLAAAALAIGAVLFLRRKAG